MADSPLREHQPEDQAHVVPADSPRPEPPQEDQQPLNSGRAASQSQGPHLSLDKVIQSLPVTSKLQVQELVSENSTLRAQLRAAREELRESREIFQKTSRRSLSARGVGVGDRPIASAAVQTIPIKTLKPLQQAARSVPQSSVIVGNVVGCQTMVGGRDCVVMSANDAEVYLRPVQSTANAMLSHDDELRRLKAEVLRSHAECASLQHAVQVMRDSTNRSPVLSHTHNNDQFKTVSSENVIPTSMTTNREDQAAVVAREAHLTAMDRIETLSEALRQANHKIGELESKLSDTKIHLAETERKNDELMIGSGSKVSPSRQQSKVLMLHKGTLTDDAQVEIRPPGTSSSAASPSSTTNSTQNTRDHSTALEQALQLTRQQLREASEELVTLRAQQQPILTPSQRRKMNASTGERQTKDVGVSAILTEEIDSLFRVHNVDMTPESVEDLLVFKQRYADAVQRGALVPADTPSGTAAAALLTPRGKHHENTSSESGSRGLKAFQGLAISELQNDVESLRSELIAAHRHIDELTYALELEKREKFNPEMLLHQYRASGAGAAAGDGPVSPTQLQDPESSDGYGFSSPLSQKQATAEISFLCDTLAATKADAESLAQQLQQAVLERDAAVDSFRELKARSETVLRGCHEITESAREDADAAITKLTGLVRTKDHEIFTLRGEIGALTRDLDRTSKQRDSMSKEADTYKQRVAQVQMAMSKLREDSNAQAQQLRELRAQLTAHATVSPRTTPRAGRSMASPKSASPIARAKSNDRSLNAEVPTSSIQALQAALDERDQLRAEVQRLSAFGSASPLSDPNFSRHSAQSVERKRRPPGSPGTLKSANKTPQKAQRSDDGPLPSDTMDEETVKAEYEELRSCFLLLASIVPKASTAREVTTGITAAIEHLRERVTALEREVKKRTIALQDMRKQLDKATAEVDHLNKKTNQVQNLEGKLAQQSRAVEKAKKAVQLSKDEGERIIEEYETRIAVLTDELEATREALATSRQELVEGRDLMMRLINEESDGTDAAYTGDELEHQLVASITQKANSVQQTRSTSFASDRPQGSEDALPLDRSPPPARGDVSTPPPLNPAEAKSQQPKPKVAARRMPAKSVIVQRQSPMPVAAAAASPGSRSTSDASTTKSAPLKR